MNFIPSTRLKKYLCIIGFFFFAFTVKAQVSEKDFRNFPINLSVQIQNFALPFKKPFDWKNLGFGIGTEVSHNSNHNWVQEFAIWWNKNRTMGNGLYFLTQTAWRPYIGNPVFGEIKAGVAYKIAFRPSTAWIQKDGVWQSDGKKGKGMWAFPIGIGLGVHDFKNDFYASPFVNYQFLLVKNYNPDIPLTPETVLQVGTRNHLKSWKE